MEPRLPDLLVAPSPSRLGTERRVGLLAGGGHFPAIVAEGARRRGLRVVAAGIRFQVSPGLDEVCDEFRVFSLGRLGAALKYFKKRGVREVSWAGWIRKEEFFRRWRWLRSCPTGA